MSTLIVHRRVRCCQNSVKDDNSVKDENWYNDKKSTRQSQI